MPTRRRWDGTPNLRYYRKVLDLVSLENTNKYLGNGWRFIEVRMNPKSGEIVGFRIGWTRNDFLRKMTEPPVNETPTVVPTGNDER